jgi:hypothetical protein
MIGNPSLPYGIYVVHGPHAGLLHVTETPAQSVLVQREHGRPTIKQTNMKCFFLPYY